MQQEKEISNPLFLDACLKYGDEIHFVKGAWKTTFDLLPGHIYEVDNLLGIKSAYEIKLESLAWMPHGRGVGRVAAQ